jgi:hypothetical protein
VETSWDLHPTFKDEVGRCWKQKSRRVNPLQNVHEKLKFCQHAIKRWVKKMVLASDEMICVKTRELEAMQEAGGNNNREAENALKEEVNGLLEQEETKWRQRAKEDWLRFGDCNTKFFHASATQRRSWNMISKIADAHGRECSTPEDIEKAFVDYYKSLFTSARPKNIQECTRAVERKVTQDMGSKLLKTYTMEEVLAAVTQMGPLKAPGLDGYTVGFYQKHWVTLGPEVCGAVLHFFNFFVMDPVLNKTHVALIPKNNNPLSVLDYRPISLCNVMYKIISKVLANRLKEILPHVISPFQSAFLPGRLITDNILAA